MAKAKSRAKAKKVEHVKKEIREGTKDIGKWSFIIGLGIAILVGLWAGFGNIDMKILTVLYGVLAVLGFIVGLINISGKEAQSFLVATIALMVGSSAMDSALGALKFEQHIGLLMNAISKMLSAINYFIAPAAFVVALILIYKLGKD